MACGFGCSATQTGPSDRSVQVSGRVFEFASNAGIADAVVTIGHVSATTNASGTYVVNVPFAGRYEAFVEGVGVGVLRIGPDYRGDLLARPGRCISRYGTVVDARTFRPVGGATVSLSVGSSVTTASDGWYRIDLGCPATPFGNNSTTVLRVVHRNYSDTTEIVGKGVFGVMRLDVALERR